MLQSFAFWVLLPLRCYISFRWGDLTRIKTQHLYTLAFAMFVVRVCCRESNPSLLDENEPKTEDHFRRIAIHCVDRRTHVDAKLYLSISIILQPTFSITVAFTQTDLMNCRNTRRENMLEGRKWWNVVSSNFYTFFISLKVFQCCDILTSPILKVGSTRLSVAAAKCCFRFDW